MRRALSLAPPLLAAVIALALGGCEKSQQDRQSEQAALDQHVRQQMQQERAAAAREGARAEIYKREAARVRDIEIRKEAGETFAKFNATRPALTPAQESGALEAAVSRVRSRMSDPATMQVRNVQFNSAKTVVCMEVNYKDAEKYQGFRRTFVTPQVIWVEPTGEDPTHHAFEVNLKRAGCPVVASAN